MQHRSLSTNERRSLLCYLDYDGVTHFDSVYVNPNRGIHMAVPGPKLFEWAPILELLLQPFPEVKIVLSTSWVRLKNLEFAKAQLPPKLQAKVIGATFDNRVTQKLDFDLMPRGLQVWRDVERRKPANWFAIDNDERGWPSWCRDRLIKTEDHLGLSDNSVQEAIRKLLVSL
ncbi:HAD domain-containing protein [Massilia aquatica]|uniref:FCP1 homology domain-containing protein n=1 Tax=Massilia aquatica TaxID=2609000 RepID=A0ABX0MJL0_9BURK|nr:HAD domain-containing protein [Massilia aquatica]NHZ43639.1 hypothetical protein [Massilia aquatica]